ncbi:MAG TPA: ATP-binding protein [Phycisphaerae bacterium]|nr:ATP-binding protein [Phycisphaerae bacterium]
MLSLEVIQGPDKGREFELALAEAFVGRQGEQVRLSDGTVSRQHARLTRRDGTWHIEDVGSVNGTFVNGIRVRNPTRLHLGDQIRCGRTLLVFGGGAEEVSLPVELDDGGKFLDSSIMATVPANEDSVIIPTPEAGAEAIENFRILYSLSTQVASIFQLDHLIQRTLETIFDVVPADRAYILLVGPGGQLIPKAVRNRGETDPGEVLISRTIINEVLQKEVGVLSSNAMRDKRFSSGKSVHDYGIRSAICVPIKGREKVLGVIHVDSSVSECTYSTEQLRLLTAIGYQTGLAIENVRLYEEKLKSERMAAVGETVAALSHHIKNVLQGLGGGTEIVEKALAENDAAKARRAWPIVHRNLDRINMVILNMLAFSKPRPPVLESINVNYIIEECVELLTPQADEQSVALMTDLAEMPPIPADAGGLHQVFLNLLINALDAVESGSGIITTSSHFDTMTRQVVVTVADNGAGIAPDQADAIFELFHTTKNRGGTGLGLAVARKVVNEHNGQISVESTPGRGTTFTVVLPALAGPSISSSETQAR